MIPGALFVNFKHGFFEGPNFENWCGLYWVPDCDECRQAHTLGMSTAKRILRVMRSKHDRK